MKCQASSYCKLYKTDKCNEWCGVYSLLRAVYSLSDIPRRYQYNYTLKATEIDYGAFTALSEYREDVENRVLDGEGLYIWSKTTGNGKTSWATSIANAYIRKAVARQRLEGVVLYINVPTYLERIRKSFNSEDKRLQEMESQIKESDLVIFDDIGAERPSEWVQEQLYRIINHRDNELKASVFTSNVSPNELRANLGDRVYSRVVNNQVIELRGGDRRCMKDK